MATSSSENGKRQKAVKEAIAQDIAEELAKHGEPDEILQQISVTQAQAISFGYLNDEQNVFLREYFRLGRKPLEAFRLAYPNNKGNDNTAVQRAYQMLKSPSIAMAVAQVEREARVGIVLTLQDHLQNLATLRDEAKKCRQYGAAVSAEVNRGKASGLYVTRTEISGLDGGPIGVTPIPTEEYLAARQKALQEV